MDNYKIGKLIKKLRKENHLTQAELGEKVGVGDRAVSKWERGITCPDISIINDLSKILGISSNELLSGELKSKTKEELNNKKDSKDTKSKSKIKSKTKKIIIIVISLILICIPILLLLNNKTYVYDMVSLDSEYVVEGKVIFKKNKNTILVSKIGFKDKETLKTIIQNYEYEIKSDNKFIYRYGYIYGTNTIESPITIYDLSKTLNISYSGTPKISRNEIIKNKMTIKFKFLDENNQEIIKEINVKLKETKK